MTRAAFYDAANRVDVKGAFMSNDGGQAISALSEPFPLTEWTLFPYGGAGLPQRGF